MALKLFTFTLAATTLATTLAAVLAAPAADPPAAAPATRPASPGDDTDLQSACAVATSVVAGAVDRVDLERSMEAFDGKYANGHVADAKYLKGEAGKSTGVYLPAPSDKRPAVRLPDKGARYVFFLWGDGLQDPRAIKFVPETPETLRQVGDLLADQRARRARPAPRPGAAGAAAKPAAPDLAASVVIPVGQRVEGGYLTAGLRLTNRGLTPVRVCTEGGEWHSAGGRNRSTTVTPARYKSDAPPAYEFARHVVALPPGASVDIPVRFDMAGGPPVGRLAATYDVDADVGAMLDVWSGSTAADPVDWPGRP